MFWLAAGIVFLVGFARAALLGPPSFVEILVGLVVVGAVWYATRHK